MEPTSATASRLKSKDYTGRSMYGMVDRFAQDIGNWAHRPLLEWYTFVKNIPYVRDLKKKEVTARPSLILSGYLPAADCKKKAILMASWFQLNQIPFRFVAVSERSDGKIHHVFVQALQPSGRWLNVDATYPKYTLGEPKPSVTRAQVLERP